ncbi:MAG: UDP-N-acetylglucosamine--N-acetylmuramyl-(pentapeptide) pyrophosphoryl-undecaprenol N-acetylglucosamine transferase [Candidatus Mcinerneyibacterium aminivorans]|uniref:UDP-N-acetylglucosamine--N-acetylmuramyl-(pentapeptide) pyrophosphoryl-undecaprenol N-acetylglucosamine transferase n=1 Tax=Candidatus Mcinerneyibacterium aminivorans TaxID=2703815 RepID=A0A5D0ME71_9BACT|nr:MAG: UDP-N-acetylglucosamine--N-acetylmuramyl-(pentapeptide) pyrophosphoryl-undecaprenol N-acetylglucosamine transferase [Candidatus Mcinerneyibacterium aminivorans]
MSICIVAGGTGGHIYPALTVAQFLDKKGLSIKWAGSNNRMESKLLSHYKIDFKGFDIYRHKENKLWIIRNILTMIKIYRYYRKNNINKIFTTGGYISFYFLAVARIMKIPFYIFEPNVIPGRVTKWFAKHAKKVFVGFKETKRYLDVDHIETTGIPVRKKIKYTSKRSRENILVFGGSQGARAINNAIKELINNGFLLNCNFNLFWITGKRDFNRLIKEFGKNEKVKLFDYVNSMDDIYKKTKLAITRAGAMTVAELIESKIPSILIPYPHAKDNHQMYNAKILEDSGCSIVLEEDENFIENLEKSIKFMLKEGNIEKFKKNIENMSFNSPEKRIYKEIA